MASAMLVTRRFRSVRGGDPRRDEQGIAMITALLIMMITTVLVTASLALAVHANDQSGDQRNLTAALHAADYGLQQQLASLSGQPGVGGASCTALNSGATALLPNTSLPAQWYSVTMPGCSAGNLTRTIISTGYALGQASPSSTPPAAAVKRTEVAHITLQPAGAVSNGGYGFPDAILALKGIGTGNLTGSGVTVSGLSGNTGSIRADGSVTLSGGQITGSLTSWGNVSLSNNPVTGDVTSAGSVTLSSSTVTGNVLAASVNQGSSTVTGTVRSGTATLPIPPPVPNFTYLQSDWLALTGAASPSGSCPSGALSGLYVVSTTCTVAPTSVNGTVAIIVNGANNVTVNVPSTYFGLAPQLYIVVTNGNLTLTDAGNAMPIFGYATGSVSVGGSTVVGQLVGGSVNFTAPTNLLSQSVSTTIGGIPTFPPDFSFPAVAAGAPTPTGFVPQINDEYLCPAGTATAC